MYAIHYQESEEEFKVIEGADTNVAETDIYPDNQLTFAEELACSLNNFHLKGKMLVTKCDECGRYFVTGRAEAKKYALSNEELPMSCRICRKKV